MSAKNDYIDHEAVITSVDYKENLVKVRIDDREECGDCPASKVCGGTGEPSDDLTIKVKDASIYKPDDIVTVRGTELMHRKAIIYATVYPCIVLIVMMVGIYLLTKNQLAAALSGIGATLVFYIILWTLRNRISHEFNFTIIGKPERAGEFESTKQYR